MDIATVEIIDGKPFAVRVLEGSPIPVAGKIHVVVEIIPLEQKRADGNPT